VKVLIPKAAAGQTIRMTVAAGNQVAIEQPRPGSLDDLIEQTQRRYPATSLVVALQMPTRGLRFEGHVVDSLPPSALNSLRLVSATGDSRPFITQSRTEIEMQQVVVGGVNLTLRVREIAQDQLLGE